MFCCLVQDPSKDRGLCLALPPPRPPTFPTSPRHLLRLQSWQSLLPPQPVVVPQTRACPPLPPPRRRLLAPSPKSVPPPSTPPRSRNGLKGETAAPRPAHRSFGLRVAGWLESSGRRRRALNSATASSKNRKNGLLRSRGCNWFSIAHAAAATLLASNLCPSRLRSQCVGFILLHCPHRRRGRHMKFDGLRRRIEAKTSTAN